MNVRKCKYTFQLDTIRSGYDRKSFFAHGRAGAIPAGARSADRSSSADGSSPAVPSVVIILQRVYLGGSDVFGSLYEMRSDDLGQSWSGPVDHAETLGPRRDDQGRSYLAAGMTPGWHAESGRLLAVGNTVRYVDGKVMSGIRPMETAYSVYDHADRTWSRWRTVDMPSPPEDPDRYFNSGSSGCQRTDLPNGEILQPIHFRSIKTARRAESTDKDPWNTGVDASVAVMRCSFDGETLRCLEVGPPLTVHGGRGLLEPSIVEHAGTFYLTMRNNDRGYVSVSDNGLSFTDPTPWLWDDGSDLGNYNTQQHWISHEDALFLVYTRRGADNDHVMRHRAPLFAAQVDPETLRVIRDTERVIVPERGARLGNFGAVDVTPTETWVTVSEWMQTTGPDSSDSRVCERYGSDNSTFAARMRFED